MRKKFSACGSKELSMNIRFSYAAVVALFAFVILLSLNACDKGKTSDSGEQDTTWTWERCTTEGWDTTQGYLQTCDSLLWESVRAECQWESDSAYQVNYKYARDEWSNYFQGWQGVKFLSPRIKELYWVRGVAIRNSPNLTSLPKEIWEIPNLSELQIYNTPKLTKIPDVTKKNEVSILFCGELPAPMPKGLENTKLGELYWVWSGLKEIPAEVRDAASTLYMLDLRYNEIDTIPPWIAELKELQYLQLSENKIRNIPESIIRLTGLTDFLFNSNNVEVLPNFICESHANFIQFHKNKICSSASFQGECWSDQEIELNMATQICP